MKRLDEITQFLGRKYRNRNEYRKTYRVLFGDDMAKNRAKIKRQRQRHLNHTGVASKARKFCIFCEKEGLVWT